MQFHKEAEPHVQSRVRVDCNSSVCGTARDWGKLYKLALVVCLSEAHVLRAYLNQEIWMYRAQDYFFKGELLQQNLLVFAVH